MKASHYVENYNIIYFTTKCRYNNINTVGSQKSGIVGTAAIPDF